VLAGILTLAAMTAFGQSASAQKGWLRASIAGWEEPERSDTLSLLDTARKLSDFIIASLATNDRQRAVMVLTPDVLREWDVAARMVASLRAEAPKLRLDYRNQAFELRSTLTQSDAPSARTWYALMPPAPAIARNFVSVVIGDHEGQTGVVIAIEPVTYAGDVPTWLLRRDAPLAPAKWH
jgi:hypothetical protein